MKIARRPTPAPHIPFISLADIAWQIIIFFLVAATFTANQALKIDIPNTSESPSATAANDKTMVVIAGESMLTLDGKPIALDQLGPEISRRLKDKKTEQERAVVMEGRDDLPFQRDTEIKYTIQKAGGIVTLAEEQQ